MPETRVEIPSKAYLVDPLPELLQQKQELNWIIEHWVEQGTLALLVGPEGSFKSFVAIDWSMSIATGREWHGSQVEPGRVLYIAGEGRTGVIRRMRGWSIHNEAVVDHLFLGRTPIELLGPADADRIAELGEFKFIVIDTLARNFGPGSENDSQDMSAAIRNADHIRQATGATVLIVHHAPLDGREEGKLRPRGSSALSGAADAIFTCTYDKDSKVITVSNTKQKDAMPADPCFMSFEVVELDDRDNFGNDITTVVLCSTEMRPVEKARLGKNQRRLIQRIASLGNGQAEIPVAIRDVTEQLGIRGRQSRSNLEDWFRDQAWVRPCVGGHLVDLQRMPRP